MTDPQAIREQAAQIIEGLALEYEQLQTHTHEFRGIDQHCRHCYRLQLLEDVIGADVLRALRGQK